MAYPEWFHRLAKKVNNWGRWGDDDEIGTINLITPEVRKQAAACVKTGKSFSLALPLSEAEGIQTGFVLGRINPLYDTGWRPTPRFNPQEPVNKGTDPSNYGRASLGTASMGNGPGVSVRCSRGSQRH